MAERGHEGSGAAAAGRFAHEEHFESMDRQAEAARFGMWVFLASEVLLFGALFALYASYRATWPRAFVAGVRDNDAILGTSNTVLLLFGSYLVALAVNRMNTGKPRPAIWLLLATVLVGFGFLAIKFTEYGMHFSKGIYPGGRGSFFAGVAPPGSPIFYTLYFGMTGLHAIHVVVGISVLIWCAFRIHKRNLSPHALEVGALYWHLVDCIWIFLWPLFYLLRS
jgi:cytochrome c oxidase subunit 3